NARPKSERTGGGRPGAGHFAQEKIGWPSGIVPSSETLTLVSVLAQARPGRTPRSPPSGPQSRRSRAFGAVYVVPSGHLTAMPSVPDGISVTVSAPTVTLNPGDVSS